MLVRLRTARGWSQQRVADEYNTLEGRSAKTGKEIGRYEREARIPTPYARKYLAQVFGVDVALLDQAVAISKGSRDGAGGEVVLPAPAPAASCASGDRLSEDAVRSADFARFIAQRNADEFVIEQLEADVHRLARTYVSHPLMEQYVEIKRLRDGVFDLLRGRQHPRQTADLYLSASRLCGLSAHVCLDLGDYDSAATHTRTASACAEAAGHEGMLAWVRSVESLIAYWTGRYEQAARLAQVGRRHRASGSIGARLASLEARALALVGDSTGTLAALRLPHGCTTLRARTATQENTSRPTGTGPSWPEPSVRPPSTSRAALIAYVGASQDQRRARVVRASTGAEAVGIRASSGLRRGAFHACLAGRVVMRQIRTWAGHSAVSSSRSAAAWARSR
ncbi:multiprotein-bridging factor 1 family protein [Streptomyces sp. NPDC056255]|uniref:helix-turn-helix domain-containing protein n=1 Tax=Streptomyces sp. NPDC056255 TaxID=3345764 RepID=UPI0035D62C00